jgi:3-deoxy-D-manno-octulosonic-acid transferase
MKSWLARALWSTAVNAALPLYCAKLWWRGRREPGYRLAWLERIGIAPAAAADRDGLARPDAVIWLHAVSLGETRAAEPLIAALREQRPGMRLVLTHGTATGRDAGRALLRDGDRQSWLPVDTPGAVKRFLRRERPDVGVLMETEIWPNLLLAARRQGVAMVLANARLSERSARRGQRVRALLRPAVESLSLVLAQTAADAARLRAAGAEQVEVSGNLKFDMTPASAQLALGEAWRNAIARPVVLAASTREGEEAMLLAAWRARMQTGPLRPLLLLVPRHPQRFDEVASLLAQGGWRCVRRSSATVAGEASGTTAAAPGLPAGIAEAEVWLGDSIGEMPAYYAAADVALLGGSFAPLGGQNLIEAAACGCPVVMGPHTFNFSLAAELALAADAAWRVDDIDAGVDRALEIAAAASDAGPALRQRVREFARHHRGSATRSATRILALIKPRPN